MKLVELGATKEKVSEFCFGAMMLGTTMNKESSFEVLDHFTDNGGNFIDTANCYSWWVGNGEFNGNESEEMLGSWIKERGKRKDIFLATKVGGRLKDPKNIRYINGVPEYEGLSKEVIIREVDQSLLRLKTDYIDLYYTHVYDSETPIEETMEALHTLVKDGKVRYVGACNLTTDQLREANNVSLSKHLTPYMVLQQEYSYIHPKKGIDSGIIRHADEEMFDYTQSLGIAFCAYSPLLKGIYGSREKRDQYYNWNLFKTEEAIRKLDLIEKLSKQLNITGNQLVLAWMLKHQPAIIPMIGFSKPNQYYENIKAYQIDLPEEIMAELGNTYI